MSYEEEEYEWVPKTKLGKLVSKGEIKNMHDALITGLPLKEHQIVDALLPGMEDEVLDVNMVQRMTDSGRRVRFSIITVVGNSDGYVGIGIAKGKEVGPTIKKSISVAKLNVLAIRRGCGSWECGCGQPHSLPFEVTGRSASARVTLKPAPRGVGLALGDVVKHVMRLSGVKDAWGFAKGQTRTTINYAQAAYNALRVTVSTRITPEQLLKLNIKEGAIMQLAVSPSDIPAVIAVKE